MLQHTSKFFIFLFYLCFIAQTALAQSSAFECKSVLNTKQSQEVLDKAQKAYSNLNSMQARFSQESFLAALEISETSFGKVWFQKPGLMRWEYLRPEEQTFLVKDESMWLYQKKDKQVIIDSFSKVLISDLPVAFLLGIGNLKKDFVLSKACENKSKDGIVLDLAPHKKQSAKNDKGLKAFLLVVDNKTYLPKAAKVSDLGANVNSIFFEDLDSNVNIPNSKFEVNFPSDVDIDDRRIGSESIKEIFKPNEAVVKDH
jgi:outer membrane lipoprotein carrier protein